jgi:hypothetical protein
VIGRTWASRRHAVKRELAMEGAIAAREQEEGDRHARGFARRYPELAKWIGENHESNEFAASMRARIRGGQLLTDNMLGALACAAATKARPAAVDVAKIEAAFAGARERGIKQPRLRLGELKFTSGKSGTANEGAIFVREGTFDEGAYLGKVVGGKFLPTRECDAGKTVQVLEAIADPAAAAKAHGKRTGQCAVCGRELERDASIDLGIGPVCAEKMGW